MAAIPPRNNALVSAIYAAYEADQGDGFRRHLGASLIGTDCARALWYTFRWATVRKHAGRLLRLFDTGNHAEARFVSDLRRISVTVLEVDPETGRQWNVSAVRGHFGGSLDGIAQGIPEAPKAWHVLEFKTHGEKSFKEIEKSGVEKAKTLHYAQMQIYMELKSIDRALYLAVNKNTDELYSERVKADKSFALRLLAKAERVIDAPRAPEKISNDPAWFQCRFCDHAPVCHKKTAPPQHCRTCLHSTPVADGAWHCAYYDGVIDKDFEKTGCVDHLYIPDFIDGDPVDSVNNTVTYKMRDGTTWIDTGKVPF